MLGFFKEFFEITPLPTVREYHLSLTSFVGALQHFLPHSQGALGCLRKSRALEENQGKVPLIFGVGWI
jgi:hypothetical protein